MNYQDFLNHTRTFVKKSMKVLHITHRGCMDGIVCHIISNNTFQSVTNAEYEPQSLEQLLKFYTFEEHDLVLVTDISLYKGFSYYNPKVIFIDHHEPSLEYSNMNNVFVNPSYCTSVLLKKYFEDLFGLDLSHLNDLVKVTNDYDLWKLQDPRSIQLSYVYYMYWSQKFTKRFFNGLDEFNSDELKYIKKSENDFKEYFNSLEIMDLGSIKGAYVVGEKFVNLTCHKLIAEESYRVVFFRNLKNSTVSLRSNIEGFHCGKYLQDLGIGGGHKEAAAFKETDIDSLRNHLKNLEKYIFQNYKEVRVI